MGEWNVWRVSWGPSSRHRDIGSCAAVVLRDERKQEGKAEPARGSAFPRRAGQQPKKLQLPAKRLGSPPQNSSLRDRARHMNGPSQPGLAQEKRDLHVTPESLGKQEGLRGERRVPGPPGDSISVARADGKGRKGSWS